jgi:hypothetical protein
VPAPTSTPKRAGRPQKYPWNLWLSGTAAFNLRQGVEYDCATQTFLNQFARRARQRGLDPQWDYPADQRSYNATEVTIWVVDPRQEQEGPDLRLRLAARAREEAVYDEDLPRHLTSLLKECAEVIEVLVRDETAR